MAKPPRQSGQRVTFTPSAAKRIARVVRMVEGGDRSIPAATQRTGSDDGNIVRGTFTGAWAKGSEKTVTDATLTSVTYAKVQNRLASLTVASGDVGCLISYVAGEWVLVAWDWHSLTGYDATKQQVLTHAANGGLAWVSTTPCT